MTVDEIYAWIMRHHHYYRTATGSWKNSLRHNLSLCKEFYQLPRSKYVSVCDCDGVCVCSRGCSKVAYHVCFFAVNTSTAARLRTKMVRSLGNSVLHPNYIGNRTRWSRNSKKFEKNVRKIFNFLRYLLVKCNEMRKKIKCFIDPFSRKLIFIIFTIATNFFSFLTFL